MTAETLALTVRADAIPAEGRRFRMEASAPERSTLADELDIAEVVALSADLALTPRADGFLALVGEVTGTIVQADVVTLEPVRQSVREAIDMILVAAEKAQGERPGPGSGDPADGEAPDLFSGGMIDLGALVKEHLALGLDLYPRAPGVEFADHIEDDPAADASPFAALRGLKED